MLKNRRKNTALMNTATGAALPYSAFSFLFNFIFFSSPFQVLLRPISVSFFEIIVLSSSPPPLLVLFQR